MLKGLKSLFSRNSQPSQSQNAQRVPQRIQFFNEDPSQQQTQAPQQQTPPAANQVAATNPTNYTTGNTSASLPGAVPASQPTSAFRPTSAGSSGTSTAVAAPSSAGSEGPAPLIGSEPSSVGPSSLATTPVPAGGFDASARAKLRSAPPARTAVVTAGGVPGSSAPRAQSASVSRPTRLVQPSSDALYGGRRNEDAPIASSAFPFQKKGTTPVVNAMPSGGAVFQQAAHTRVVPDPFDA